MFLLLFVAILVSPTSCTVCAGTEEFLDGRNVLQFEGCERVSGSLIINQHSTASDVAVSLTYNKLLLLNQIREIDGYLVIDGLNHTQITDLRFLRQLEVIHGQQTLQLFGRQEYSLVIQNNPHLLTLNLASLRRIENGGVRVNANPSLCLVDTIAVENYLVHSRLARVGGLGQDCAGVSCHEQCEQSSGCWGVFADECVQCRGYQFTDTCVDSCNLSLSSPMESSMQCLPLDAITAATPTPLNHAPTSNPPTNSGHTPSSQYITISSATTQSVAATGGESSSQSSHLVISLSVVSSTLLVAVLGVLLACLVYRQAKKKERGTSNKGETALLLIQHQEKYEESNVPVQVVAVSSNHSTCALLKSQLSLSSLSSKITVRRYEGSAIKAGMELGTPVDVVPAGVRRETAPRIGIADCNDAIVSLADTSDTVLRARHSTDTTDSVLRVRSLADASDATVRAMSPGYTNPARVSVDSGCYDSATEPDLNASSHADHMTTTADLQIMTHDGKRPMVAPPFFRPPSAGSSGFSSKVVEGQGTEDNSDLKALFANWKPHNHVSPVMQRPMTMGGVYSTGHHPQHHRNRSHGNSSHRGSLTSSYGTGTSTRTSAVTSRSASQQTGSVGCNSGVFGTSARQSKTPQKQETAKSFPMN